MRKVSLFFVTLTILCFLPEFSQEPSHTSQTWDTVTGVICWVIGFVNQIAEDISAQLGFQSSPTGGTDGLYTVGMISLVLITFSLLLNDVLEYKLSKQKLITDSHLVALQQEFQHRQSMNLSNYEENVEIRNAKKEILQSSQDHERVMQGQLDRYEILKTVLDKVETVDNSSAKTTSIFLRNSTSALEESYHDE